jgi:hypothetical protein
VARSDWRLRRQRPNLPPGHATLIAVIFCGNQLLENVFLDFVGGLVNTYGRKQLTGVGQVDAYKVRAGQCVQLARSATDSKAKLTLLEMARAWLLLAEQARKNSKTTLVYETPTPYPVADS